MATFSNLPSELKLYIGDFLLPRDHFRYAASCRQLWDLLQNEVAFNKRRITYWCISLRQSKEGNNKLLKDLCDNPSLFEIVTTVILSDVLHNPILELQPGSTERNLTGDPLKNIIRQVLSTADRRKIYEQVKDCTFPKAFFPMLTPNIEMLVFTSDIAVHQLFFSCLQPDQVKLAFPRLSHIRIETTRFSDDQATTIWWVKELAVIPGLQCIRSNGTWDEGQAGQAEAVDIKELELIDSNVSLEQSWTDFLYSFKALERLHYSQTCRGVEVRNVQVPRVIIHALLGSASANTLTTLVLDGFPYDKRQAQTIVPELLRFKSLKNLRCDWRDLVPSIDEIAYEKPWLLDKCTELNTLLYVQGGYGKPYNGRILDLILEMYKHTVHLWSLLPESLVNLTLSRCYHFELRMLYVYITSGASQLERLFFDLVPNLEFQDYSMIQRIFDELEKKKIAFVDGCQLYAEKAAPESWIYY